MAYNTYNQAPFWHFVRSFDQRGEGVDHSAPGQASGSHPTPPPPPGAYSWGAPQELFGGFPGEFRHPFGGPDFGGRGGRRARHCRREGSGEEESRSRTASSSGDQAEGEGPVGAGEGHRGPGRYGRRGQHEHSEGEAGDGHEGRRGPRGFRRGRGGHRGGWGHHGRRGPPPPFGGPGGMGGFDLSGLFEALNSHPVGQQPWAKMLRQYAQQAGFAGEGQRSGETAGPEEAENTFTPPIDVFSTETAYVLHIALPGAKKEDVGVNYDSDKGELNVAGVVYRHGDEEFLKSLSQSERKVGMFERTVKLPPAHEEKEEVDGDSITAKLEDGVLVVTVPKIEKDWTEVKRVDIK
ncbi:hypothetical protein WAI453_012168 [Rhynchosporium graminicola]|uniref:SHSP domain-containing protein n=1 Tax=Rhynchosporium graminicola TaxID=2792576 RepID=A0A1E1KXG6_9HELO|nr:uncharacterized protein RCO7_06009 [Rhynchosporium commune]